VCTCAHVRLQKRQTFSRSLVVVVLLLSV